MLIFSNLLVFQLGMMLDFQRPGTAVPDTTTVVPKSLEAGDSLSTQQSYHNPLAGRQLTATVTGTENQKGPADSKPPAKMKTETS